MNYEALKHIYRQVLIYQNKIRYDGENKYTITSYRGNGNKWWEREYKNNQLHGLSQVFIKGIIVSETKYQNGKRIWD